MAYLRTFIQERQAASARSGDAAAAGRFRGVCALIASTLMEGTSQSCNAVGAGLSLGVPSFGNDKQLTHMRWGGDGGALPQGLCAHFCARTLVE